MKPETQTLLAIGIFALTYALLISERLHRTAAALLGAALVVGAGVLNQKAAFRAVDFSTIGLLLGMMIIVNFLRRTGGFEWLAVKTVKAVRGQPLFIMIGFFLFTAVVSAFIDNVTTVLLIAPLTVIIARSLGLNPIPLLYAEIVASNVGGTATLIGDPPNIIIGTHARISFLDFLTNLTPVVAVISVVLILYLALAHRKEFGRGEEFARLAAEIPDADTIKDPVLLWKCLIVLGLVVVGFLLHGALGFEASTVALLGATLLLVIVRADPHEIFSQIEWPTLFFFVGLFVVVGGVEQAGVLERMGRWMVALTHGDLLLTSMAILWFSALLSAIVDNIPATMALVPVIVAIAAEAHPGVSREALLHLPYTMALWWSLALGACLGGNATIVGASANVVVAGLAERAGFPISFRAYLKVGIPVTLASLVIAAAYVVLRYVI